MSSNNPAMAPKKLQLFGEHTSRSGVAKPVMALLHIEGAVVLSLTVWAYQNLGGNWWFFAALFLVPDFFMLGYLRSKQAGALVYNIGHTYLAPGALALLGLVRGISALMPIALIWAAHIGFDRMLGYGLKDPAGFKVTHLG